MTDERLDYLRGLARVHEEQMLQCPPSSFSISPLTEAVEEIDRLRTENARLDLIEQMCGDECPTCGWGGIRDPEEGCAFCEVHKLRQQIAGHCVRIAKQSDQLSQNAERNVSIEQLRAENAALKEQIEQLNYEMRESAERGFE